MRFQGSEVNEEPETSEPKTRGSRQLRPFPVRRSFTSFTSVGRSLGSLSSHSRRERNEVGSDRSEEARQVNRHEGTTEALGTGIFLPLPLGLRGTGNNLGFYYFLICISLSGS